MKELNPSIKHHIVVGLLMALWIFAFAFIIKPFDDGTLNFRSWFSSVLVLVFWLFCVTVFWLFFKKAFIRKSQNGI